MHGHQSQNIQLVISLERLQEKGNTVMLFISFY
jgi:excinuclease UvrABC ATPase subunit